LTAETQRRRDAEKNRKSKAKLEGAEVAEDAEA
jgi:hypothetical protein